jgi:Bacterial antitoxin of ParD toxin-antitoxin type II system and RHH
MGKIDQITAAIEQLSTEDVGRLRAWLDAYEAQAGMASEQSARSDRDFDALRAALIEGESSGPATPLDFEDFVRCKKLLVTRTQ